MPRKNIMGVSTTFIKASDTAALLDTAAIAHPGLTNAPAPITATMVTTIAAAEAGGRHGLGGAHPLAGPAR